MAHCRSKADQKLDNLVIVTSKILLQFGEKAKIKTDQIRSTKGEKQFQIADF
jgi:hypothetical protein